jgi:hypothetical protein
MEALAQGTWSEVRPAAPLPGLTALLVRERTHATYGRAAEVLDGLESEARHQATLGPPFRHVLEVTRSPRAVALLREHTVGLVGSALVKRLAAAGRLLPLEVWLGLAETLIAVPEEASCGPAAGGGLRSMAVDVRGRVVIFPDPLLALADPRLQALLPIAPRLGRDFELGSLSPEQIRGLPTRGASRVFSLAWALAELLTTTSPFQRHTTFETLVAVARGELSWDTGAHPQCSRALAQVLRQALHPKPEARFSSLPAFRGALRDAAGVGPAPAAEVAAVVLGVDFPEVQERLRALAQTPDWLPFAWRDGGLGVLEDALLESLVPLDRLPRRVHAG